MNNIKKGKTKFYFNHLTEIQHIDIDIIINLAGETIAQRWTKDAKNRIYESRISTTKNLINFMRSQKNPPSLFISGSAVGYYGTNNDKTLTEENISENSPSEFSRSLCQSWEDAASPATALGARTVLLRIGPVLEKNGGMLSKLLLSFRLGLGSQIGDGHQWISWIDRDDLIKLIIFIINQKNIYGPVNATAPNPVQNKEFSLVFAKALKRPCFLKTPSFILKMIFGQMAEEIMLNGQKILPEKAILHGFKFSYPTIEESLFKILKS